MVESKELKQIQSDVRRCVNFHPLIRLELVQKKIVTILSLFLAMNPDCAYIQGLDSIVVVLYTQLQGTSKSSLILPLLKQINTIYLRPFIEKETHHANFRYASLLTSRLVAFHEPTLYKHFKDICFQHDFYLVQWFMTLFAHTLPIPQVVQLWTYLFTQKVEYLFFITVAILEQLRDKLVEMDLNSTL